MSIKIQMFKVQDILMTLLSLSSRIVPTWIMLEFLTILLLNAPQFSFRYIHAYLN